MSAYDIHYKIHVSNNFDIIAIEELLKERGMTGKLMTKYREEQEELTELEILRSENARLTAILDKIRKEVI